MPFPWLRVLNAALGLTEFVGGLNRGGTSAARGALREAGAMDREDMPIETKLAGAAGAALKEAFDRDHQRLALDREQRETDRKRAERLLRLDLAREAADRELTHLRWLGTLALVSWLGTTLLVVASSGWSAGLRVVLGIGWGCFLAALATAFVAQSRLVQSLSRLPDRGEVPTLPSSDTAATAAIWLLVSGLGAVAIAVLVR
jgi:hypothetical protein